MHEVSNFCTPICDPIFDCPHCVYAMEDATIKSALNMGTPECYYCGDCGTKFDYKDKEVFAKHVNVNGDCSYVNT